MAGGKTMNFDPRSVIDCIWIILLIVWCLVALRASPTARRQPISARLAHILPLAVCCVLLFRSTVVAGPLGWLAPDAAFVAWTGAMITALGVTFAIAARLFLGKNWSGW